MPRMKFALVFTTDPPAVDVIREDELVDKGEFQEGKTCRALRPSWKTEMEGTILRIGNFSGIQLQPAENLLLQEHYYFYCCASNFLKSDYSTPKSYIPLL